MVGLIGEEGDDNSSVVSDMCSSQNDAVTSVKKDKGTDNSAFSRSWLPSNQRAITYMLYRKLTEEYLRKTLLRLRASDQTIEKAVEDLRKLKTLTPEPEIGLKKRESDSLVIHGDGSDVKGLSPFVFTPLRRCDGKTSVRVDSVSLLVDVFENKSIGDSEWRPRNIMLDLVDVGVTVDSISISLEEPAPSGRDANLSLSSLESWVNRSDDIRENGNGRHSKSRRGSSSNIPYIFGRIGKIFHRRSAVN